MKTSHKELMKQLELARKVMAKHNAALRELAK